MVDWQAIKTEYITTATSYRELARKYGIAYRTVSMKGKEEGWVELRNQFVAKTSSEIIDAIGEQQVDRAVRFRTVADKLLDKIEAIVDSVEAQDINPKSLRSLTAAVKDLKEIQGIKSNLDMQEQQARIDNLRKQVQKDEDHTDVIEVVFAAGPEEWNE